MGKYSITHTCGHEVTHRLFGPHADRERREKWLASVVCEECSKAARAAAASSANATEGYSPLSGTSKQVAWAEQIRLELLAAANQQFGNFVSARLGGDLIRRNVLDPAERDHLLALLDQFTASAQTYVAGLASETSAKWWIEHRNDRLFNLVMIPVAVERVDLLPLIRRPGLFPASAVAEVDKALAAAAAEEEQAAQAANTATLAAERKAREHSGTDPYTVSYYIKRLADITGPGTSMRVWHKTRATAGDQDDWRVYVNKGRDAIAVYRFDARAGEHRLHDYKGERAEELANLCSELFWAADGARHESRPDIYERLERYVEVPQ